MHSVERMEAALALAKRLGWQVRQEYMGEVGGGACEIGGRKIIFLDIALNPLEQFESVAMDFSGAFAVTWIVENLRIAPFQIPGMKER